MGKKNISMVTVNRTEQKAEIGHVSVAMSCRGHFEKAIYNMYVILICINGGSVATHK